VAVPDSDVSIEFGEPIEHEGRETLLPSVMSSVLSTKSIVAEVEHIPPPLPPADNITAETQPVIRTPEERSRGARQNDIIGGRYIVEGQLGRGGMGRVMRVKHQALGKAFALKLIKSAIATNPRIRELFYREARLASALSHDNICSIVDFGLDDTFGLFMVMELLEGQTVHAKLRDSGRMAPKVACDIMWQVADAVRFIHSRTILHGDIKTENMYLVRNNVQRRVVKLLDFGLARADLGRSEGVDGTPEYIAPERIDGAPASQASDIYALGIVFFELLTARLPFAGDLKELFRQHRTVDVPAPSKILEGEQIDDRVDQIIARATAKDPAKRHPDVSTFMYELRTLMQMLGVDNARARRRVQDAGRERKDLDHRVKGAAEIFNAVNMPMAACDVTGRVRCANPAFLSFVGAAGDAGGIELRDSALPDVYPTLFEDLAEAAAKRRPIKRVIYLNEGGDRVIEAAVVLNAAPSTAEVTAGEVFLVIHPLRSLLT